MSLKCGIVGLPNVGKSTLFNAITKTSIAQAANYPFCTIEPNFSTVSINDIRLKTLAQLANSQSIIPNYIEVYDIAGLVKGASNGEGLGNKFLSHIRDVNAIIHVVRCFEDADITHVENTVDPLRDIDIINTELMLSDLEQVKNMLQKLQKKAKSSDKVAQEMIEVLTKLEAHLGRGNMAKDFFETLELSEEAQKEFKQINIITAKSVLLVANVKEDDIGTGNKYSQIVKDYAAKNHCGFVLISAQIESELSLLSDEQERLDFLQSLGVNESGLDKISHESFKMLNLISYFTIGPKEAHAWTITTGMTAPKAAGVIHTDFEKGFIRAEVISYQDYIEFKTEQAVKDAGKLRVEGKEYIVNDGDIMHFRFNV